MRRFLMTAAIVLTVGGTGMASARDVNGAEQIMSGDYVAAERILLREQRLFPHDTDLLINLATVYARTGRASEARRLYALAAAQPDETLDMAGDRTMSSRKVAMAGLRTLGREVAGLR